MKHADFVQEIEKDLEYLSAKDALKAQFALGDAVIHSRLARGWSQTELAQRVGTKQANISRIESGLANPTLNLIQKILQVLDLEINFLPVPQAASPRQAALSQPGSPAPGSKVYRSGQIQPSHRIQDGE